MLVLASASPRRRQLLSDAGVAFHVHPVDVDETVAPGADPEQAARGLALRKARAARLETDGPVLAADTLVVAADGEILGKPRDADDARRMLRKHSDATQRVVTGVCLALSGAAGGPPSERVESAVTLVTMRALADDEIEEYVVSGEPFGKAGGYAIQEGGDRFVTRVDGSWSNVVGLPMELVEQMLDDAGLRGAGPARSAEDPA